MGPTHDMLKEVYEPNKSPSTCQIDPTRSSFLPDESNVSAAEAKVQKSCRAPPSTHGAPEDPGPSCLSEMGDGFVGSMCTFTHLTSDLRYLGECPTADQGRDSDGKLEAKAHTMFQPAVISLVHRSRQLGDICTEVP